MKLSQIEKHKRFVSVVICIFIWGSASQGVVVCVSFDGPIALKPAFHTHSQHAGHTEEAEVRQFTEESDSHAESRHCQACIDIPIPFDLPDGCSKQSEPQLRSQILGLLVHPNTALETISVFTDVSEPFYITTAYFDPLRTIILRV